MTEQPHAHTFQLPGWPSPPRVRDIVAHADSWGWIAAQQIASDRHGYLWVSANATPRPTTSSLGPNHALVAWTPECIGVFVPTGSYSHITTIERKSDDDTVLEASDTYQNPLDMAAPWIKVATVLTEPVAASRPEYESGTQ